MKVRPIKNSEQIKRKYGIMKVLAGGNSFEMKTERIDFKILEIYPHMSTSMHYHCKSETVFHVVRGCAELETNDGLHLNIQTGDTIIVDVKEFHKITNKQEGVCVIMEIMSPPYDKTDIYDEKILG